jgi:hypothetical protein
VKGNCKGKTEARNQSINQSSDGGRVILWTLAIGRLRKLEIWLLLHHK